VIDDKGCLFEIEALEEIEVIEVIEVIEGWGKSPLLPL